MIVDCDMRKWVERPHWRFDAKLLGRDGFGAWLGSRIGTRYTGPRGGGAWRHNFVVLVPSNQWWIASWNDVQQPQIEVYVDITTPPQWRGGSIVTAIDLDLDVARLRDGRVELWDEDEFADHRVRYAYPDDVVARATATAEELLLHVGNRREPFGDVGPRWLKRLARGSRS